MKEQPHVPIQPVEKPIICSPYEEPNDHWIYDTATGAASRAGYRRPASYWYKTERTGSAQQSLFQEEQRDDLPLVNWLRDDVRRWREADYRGASNVTRELSAGGPTPSVAGVSSSASARPSRRSSTWPSCGCRDEHPNCASARN
jgi:hypothetical protein